jgi:hypothetical protein
LLFACAKGTRTLGGWHALQSGMELRYERGVGPSGETAFCLLYTIFPGQDYAIERAAPFGELEGAPALRLRASATRVLHLAVVLKDRADQTHECAQTLLPGTWRELSFEDFGPGLIDWASVESMQVVDQTGGLGGQGPVSLKLLGLPQ